MKIKCKCGNIIVDITDNIPYKGYVISDMEYNKLLDIADQMIESTLENKEALAMTFRRIMSGYIRKKNIYQCVECGRIIIDNNNEICFFEPEGHSVKDLLEFEGEYQIDLSYLKK